MSITAVLDSSDQKLNNDAPNPSDVVHLYQYMSGHPGRLPQPFGKENLQARFVGVPSLLMEKKVSSTITSRCRYVLEKH
jgi:hypothetical protein